MDNPGTTQIDGAPKTNIWSGMRLPPWKKGGGHPSPFSASDMNLRDAVLNAVLAGEIRIGQAVPDSTGAYTPSGKFTWSNLKLILDLLLAPSSSGGGGTANIVPMQVVSYTTTNEYLSAKNGSFTAADTFTATGSAVNVALPWELRPAQKPSGASLFPAYATNDIIWVLSTSTGQNGVYVSGSELTLMDLGLGRSWNTSLLAFTIASTTNGDYWVCTPVGGGSNVNVAKPPKLRNSLTSATIDGVSWTYSYTTTIERTATITGYSEYQRISPRPLSGDLIYAVNIGATATGVTSVIYQDINADGRAWTAKVDQTTP